MDKYLAALDIHGPIVTIALVILIAAELIKVGRVFFDFFAPKILGIQTRVSKERKYRKQVEDNNVKINEYLDVQTSINKNTDEILKKISSKIDTLSDDVVELKIEEMREKILDFASAINAGRDYTKEQYNFILKLYNTYEEFIERTGRTNDEVEISMEIVRSYYSYNIKHHCFVEDKLNDARIQSMLKNNLDDNYNNQNKDDKPISDNKKPSKSKSNFRRKKSHNTESNDSNDM